MSATFEPVDLMIHDEYDVAIAYCAAKPRQGIIAESLGLEDIVPLCAPRLLGGKNDLVLEEIAQMPLIESAVNPMRWSDWFALQGVKHQAIRRKLAFDRAHLAVSAAAEGLGVVLESTRFAGQELAQGTLIRLGQTLKPVSRDLHVLLYRKVQADRAPISAFRAWLLAECEGDARS